MGLLKTPTKMDGEVTSGKKNPVSGDSETLAQGIMSGYEPTMQKLGLKSSLPQTASMKNGIQTENVQPVQNADQTIQDANVQDQQWTNTNTKLKEGLCTQDLLPTPAQRDYKGGNSMEHLTRKDKSEGNSHQDQLPNAIK